MNLHVFKVKTAPFTYVTSERMGEGNKEKTSSEKRKKNPLGFD
jgi:hypothetical protein